MRIKSFKSRGRKLFFPFRDSVFFNSLDTEQQLKRYGNHNVMFLLITLFHLCASGQQMHTESNAVSIGSESNTTTGWGGGAIKSVDSVDPYHGSYAMKLMSTTGATGRYTTYSFSAVVGDVYDISIWVKPGSQTVDPGFTGWSGLSGFSVTWITGTVWEEYTFTVTATSTSPEIRVYTGIASGSTGDILYVDSVSIQKQNQNLHTHSNAASIGSEANSISGWGGSATESSVSTEFYSGNYSLKFESPNDGWNYAAYSFPTTPNEQYVVSFHAKSASSTNPGLYWGGGGVVENQKIDITSSNWTRYTKTVTAVGSTIALNVYPGTPALTGESVYIDHVSIVPVAAPDTEAPTPPTLTSSGQTSTTVDLSWSGATDDTGVTGYKVYKDFALEATLTNVTTYQMTGLSPSTSYSFAVRALDAAGNQSTASNINVTTNSSSDTQSPTAPTLTSSSNTDTTVDLSWSGATDDMGVTGYKVYKDGVLEATLGNVGTYEVTGLTAGTTYSFTVIALDAAGNESVASSAVSVTTDPGSGGTGSSIWTETNGVASYDGDVAVGATAVPIGYKMSVDGKLLAEEIKVQLSDNWPDYVFGENYDLPTLEEVKRYIEDKGHLPNIPSAEEVKASGGVKLGEMNRLFLEKIEELTLYLLELKKENQDLRNEIDQLKSLLYTSHK